VTGVQRPRLEYRPDVEVWTCPEDGCGQSYRCPAGWEAAVFLAARRAAQVIHASRHGRRDVLQRRRRSSDPRPTDQLPPEWADPSWATPPPRLRRRDDSQPPVQPDPERRPGEDPDEPESYA
jgi:hypothetical protein